MPRRSPSRAVLALVGSGCTAAGPASTSAANSPTPAAATTGGGATTPAAVQPSTTTPDGPFSTRLPTGIPTADPTTASSVEGVDVSAYQPRVDWTGLATSGVRFAYVKATEGTSFVSPTYAAQRDGARAAGPLVGGYHYARPATSSGAAQARHLLSVTSGWRSDGRTLPNALDLEDSTTGPACHGRTPAQLLSATICSRTVASTRHAVDEPAAVVGGRRVWPDHWLVAAVDPVPAAGCRLP